MTDDERREHDEERREERRERREEQREERQERRDEIEERVREAVESMEDGITSAMEEKITQYLRRDDGLTDDELEDDITTTPQRNRDGGSREERLRDAVDDAISDIEATHDERREETSSWLRREDESATDTTEQPRVDASDAGAVGDEQPIVDAVDAGAAPAELATDPVVPEVDLGAGPLVDVHTDELGADEPAGDSIDLTQ